MPYDVLEPESTGYDVIEPEASGYDVLEPESRAAKRAQLQAEMEQARKVTLSERLLNTLAYADQLVRPISEMNPLTAMPRAAHGLDKSLGLIPAEEPFPLENSVPVLQLPVPTPENVSRAGQALGLNIYPSDTGAQVTAGAGQAAKGLADFFLTPEGLATLGAGAAPQAAKAALAAGFAGSMAAHVPEQAAILGEATVEGGPLEVTRESLNLAATAGFPATIAAGALRRGLAPPGRAEVPLRQERPSIQPETGRTEPAPKFEDTKPIEEVGRSVPAEPPAEPPAPKLQAALLTPAQRMARENIETMQRLREQKAAEPEPLPQEPTTPTEPLTARESLVPVTVTDADITAASQRVERAPDVLDMIGDYFPSGVKFASKADFGEQVKNARGRARELMSHDKGEAADSVLDALNREGLTRFETENDLADAMLAAGESRIGERAATRKQAQRIAEEQARHALFEKNAFRASRTGTEPVAVPTLFLDETFKLGGHEMRVVEFPLDAETGQPFGVRLEGAYGSEIVRSDQTLHIDEGSLKSPTAEPIGMGGAVPTEFANTPRTATSIKNATVDQERAQRGLPAAIEPARRTFGAVWDEAMARIDQAPDSQEALLTELRAQPRALTDLEDAMLLHRQIDLQNEYGKATRDLAFAYEDAQAFPNRLAAVEELKLRVSGLSDRLLDLYDINKRVGTETGRGLAARKMMAYEDFSLAKMELDKRAANDGRPITDAERGEMTRLQEKIATTQKAFDDYVAKADAERAARQATDEVNNLIDVVAKTPGYDRQVISLADRIVKALETEADKARARLKEKFARLSAGVDPTLLADLATIGAAKIARGTLDFTRWSREMVDEFGEKVVPWLNQAWTRSNARIDEAVKRVAKGKTALAVKRAVRKEDPTDQRDSIVEGLRTARAEERPFSELGDYIRKLAENFVRSGIKERDPLIDAVHNVLKAELDPAITRRQTMDAISGYGDFKPLNPDKIKVELRDLKGQMQQVAKLEDLQARRPLKKSGLERRAPSDEERRLIKQVEEAKRRFGVVVTDPARQLKSALDAIKTRLRHQIADLNFQIATKQKIVRERTPPPFDAETTRLTFERDRLKTQFEEIFNPGLTDAQRVQNAVRNLQVNIAIYEQRLANRDISPLKSPSRTPSTPELEALRARRDALREEFKNLVDTLDPARREGAALSALKSRLASRTAELQDRLARGDFGRRPRRTVTLDNEALRLKAIHEQAKAEWHRGLIRDRLANRTTGQKIYAGAKEALNLPRTVLSSWDVSAVLRQGGFISIGNPGRALRSIGPMFRALASERQAIITEQEILNRPNAPLYARSKLYLAPHESLKLSAMEEQIMSTLANRIPGVKASNRAYITFLNKLRADSFDQLVKSIARKNGSLNQPELEAIANYINVATGRGNLGKASAAAETLATVFFSPRLMASRFQLLAGEPLYRGSAATRRAIAMEYGKFLAGMAVIYGLASMAGADLESDPRSSDFGKLRFGDTRVDPLAGLSQNTVLLSRLVSGETMNSAGQVRAIRGEGVKYGQDSAADLLARFLRSKLSPIVGAGVDIASGENVIGEKVTPGTVATNLAVPLSFRDILDAMEEHGVAEGTALGILSLFGFGLQHYEARK